MVKGTKCETTIFIVTYLMLKVSKDLSLPVLWSSNQGYPVVNPGWSTHLLYRLCQMTGTTGKGGSACTEQMSSYLWILQSYKLSANILNVLTHPSHVGSHYAFEIFFSSSAFLGCWCLPFLWVEQSTAHEVGRVVILWTLLHSEGCLACWLSVWHCML